ncbi:hypothetical protein ABZ547_34005 [Streptomyces sparsogenes]|uniref:hypothetical protein n=1 Tax=Streptomyces sparsogenes TaxID=67365 RepID=UPI0033FFD8B2
MTTTPDRLNLPARRRRNARLIAALTQLIGACAEAAGTVYQPIADAPPDQEAVEVDLLPCIQVSLSAALLLDVARAEDDARWPASVTRERAAAGRTFAARCAVAAAGEVIEPDGPLGAHGQAAAMELASASEDVAARWRHDPEQAVALVQELVASDEFTEDEVLEDEVLDDAVDYAVLTGLLTLQEARTASDPSTAAELCLSAIPHIALAVTLASAELGLTRPHR